MAALTLATELLANGSNANCQRERMVIAIEMVNPKYGPDGTCFTEIERVNIKYGPTFNLNMF